MMPENQAARRSYTVTGSKISSGLLLIWLVVGFLVSLGLLYMFDIWSFKTLFQVTAETEFVEGHLDIDTSKSSTHLNWYLQEATLHFRDGDRRRRQIEVSRATLTIGGPAKLEAERLSHGSLVISLEKAGDSTGAFKATVKPEGKELIHLNPPVTVVMADPAGMAGEERTISLPIRATAVAVGREPLTSAKREQPILRSGELEVLGRTALQGRVYIARASALRAGDVVTESGAEQGKENTFSVLVRVDERPAMQVLARVEADLMAVAGFYTDPRVEELTLFNKLANDRILAGLGTVLGLIITLLGVVVTTRSEPNDVTEPPVPSSTLTPTPLPEEEAEPDPEPTPVTESVSKLKPMPEPQPAPAHAPSRDENET